MKHEVTVLSGHHPNEQLDRYVHELNPGGLLFIYGEPHWLPEPAVHLARQLVFKYWIVLDISLTHRGLLMFWKPGGQFHLDTDAVRVTHAHCAACDRYLKDWGGKRHLMNPRGAALSDVWRDFPKRAIRDHIIPKDVLNRIHKLTGKQVLHVVGKSGSPGQRPVQWDNTPSQHIELNRVMQTDCVKFLENAPANIFDLCFADPPYNLQKMYSGYEDAQAEQEYLNWCDRWLAGIARTLKPGGSLFVLNLPKWAIHHAAFLNRQLSFHRWIVWDALSEPRGKLMPAHYALLWYTKPGALPVVNKLPAADSPKYCLRSACVRKHKREKVEVSDVWSDIHRIKHKRDRDAHPCQLPEKLMERIIQLASNPGDVVFDPFCGTGTTAVVAKRLGRNFVVTDSDPKYVRITRQRLNGSMRATAPRRRPVVSKREVELQLQELARALGRKPAVEEIPVHILRRIDSIYPNRGAAIKRCRVALIA